jgi:hypothetical protein
MRPVAVEFHLSLEYIGVESHCYQFRIAFENSADRFLLAYPEVTGLRFTSSQGAPLAEWTTRRLVSEPQDEFVLRPSDRIAFDLQAVINIAATAEVRWAIHLPPGEYDVQYSYWVRPDLERYDYLAKGSRFAAMTKPWGGEAVSNIVHVVVS